MAHRGVGHEAPAWGVKDVGEDAHSFLVPHHELCASYIQYCLRLDSTEERLGNATCVNYASWCLWGKAVLFICLKGASYHSIHAPVTRETRFGSNTTGGDAGGGQIRGPQGCIVACNAGLRTKYHADVITLL